MLHSYRRCLLLVFGLLLLSVSGQAQTSEGLVPDSTELRVLRQFYYATGGASWTTRTNWLSGTTLAEAATWHGVGISGGDVVSLNGVNNGLGGRLPASLGLLKGLTTLAVGYNRGLYGAIPPELGQLMQLTYLGLQANSLSGPLPASLGDLSQLQRLHIQSNLLTGMIPASFTQLQQLYELWANGMATASAARCPPRWARTGP